MIDENPYTILCGDNVLCLDKIKRNSIDLVYMDPPFDSGRNYNSELLCENGQIDIFGFEDKYDNIEQQSEMNNADTNSKSPNKYLDDIVPVLKKVYLLLKPNGSLYLHCDQHAVFRLKRELDGIFKEKNYMNMIIWHYTKMNNANKNYIQNHDNILFYVKDINKNYTFNKYYEDEDSALLTRLRKLVGPDGKIRWKDIKYTKTQLTDSYIKTRKKELMREFIDDDIIIDFNEKSRKKIDNVWYIPIVKGNSKEYLNFRTQKPEALLERIISVSSNEGDTILDPYMGSGTTLRVAKRLKRHCIGIDKNRNACILAASKIDYKKSDIDGLGLERDRIMEWTSWKRQAFACAKMRAINTNPNGSKGLSGPDHGVDGYIPIGDEITSQYVDAILAYTDTPVGEPKVTWFKGKLDDRKVNKGFLISTRFTKNAEELVSKYNREFGTKIVLINILDLCDRPYWIGYLNPFKPGITLIDGQDGVSMIHTKPLKLVNSGEA